MKLNKEQTHSAWVMVKVRFIDFVPSITSFTGMKTIHQYIGVSNYTDSKANASFFEIGHKLQ